MSKTNQQQQENITQLFQNNNDKNDAAVDDDPILNLQKMLNNKSRNTPTIKQPSEMENNTQKQQEITQQLYDILNKGYKTIKGQHNRATEKLKNKHAQSDDIQKRRNGIKAQLDEPLTTFVKDEFGKFFKQQQLEDEQLQILIKQNILQDNASSTEDILKGLQESAQHIAKKEQEAQQAGDVGAGEGNPLLSSNYLQRIMEFLQKQSQREQEIQQSLLQNENKDLESKTQTFQTEQQKKVMDKQAKSQQLSNALEENSILKQQNKESIKAIYDNELKPISKRYKKMLGLREKYYQEICKTNDQEKIDELIKQYQRDINKIANMSAKELTNEDAKYNKKGQRIESPQEKQERKDKEEQQKKEAEEQKKAEKLQQDKKNNIDSMETENNDERMKNALQQNTNNINSNDKITNKTMDIKNIDNGNDVKNNINIGKQKKQMQSSMQI